MARYLSFDLPEAEADIQRDVDRLVAAILAVTEPRAIVLGGGFGRGEGSVRHDGMRWRARNDYDLWVILDNLNDAEAVRALARPLADELGVDYVDIATVATEALPRFRHTQSTFDLREASQVVWGDASVLEALPKFPPSTIHQEDALLLLCNRMAGLLLGFSADIQDGQLSDFQHTQLLHAMTACGDAVLLVCGRYAPRFSVRAAPALEVLHRLCLLPIDQLALIEAAYSEKTQGVKATMGLARDSFLVVVDILEVVLRWMLCDHVGRGCSDPDILIRAARRYPRTGPLTRLGLRPAPMPWRIRLSVAATLLSHPTRPQPSDTLRAAHRLMNCPKSSWPDMRIHVLEKWNAYCH